MMMTVNPRKTESVRRLGSVDISKLREAVLAIPEDVWERENSTKPNRFDALDRTYHIPFRFVREFDDWRVSEDMRLWSEWRALLEPVLQQATAAYGYKRGGYPRIMLARMAPGGVIHPHRDGNPSAKWPHKIHIPLQTNPRVTFEVEGVGYHMEEGEAVEVNNMGVHAVTNGGDTDRIHLIFEYYDLDQPDPEWINALTGAVGARA
jgi:hypothetical protein